MIMRARSAAKVNLSLDIVGLRPNGYHELRSVVHTVGVWDELELEIVPGGEEFALTCNRPELETENNLCVRAAMLWKNLTGQKFGARLRLTKHIPSGAGLGGGSGNAAAVLLLLEAAFPDIAREFEAAPWRRQAATLGADVPLFLEGGCQLMEGIGEIISPLPALPGWLVIQKPERELSTPAVYRAWDVAAYSSHHDTNNLLAAIRGGVAPASWAPRIGNDLERPAQDLGLDVARELDRLRGTGAVAARMTGSGSATYAIFATESEARAASDTVHERLAKDVHDRSTKVWVAPLVECGVSLAGGFERASGK